MPIIAITGRKGGIGKSTITAHLAGALISKGHRVAALDADPQQSLTMWSGLGDGLLAEIVSPLLDDKPMAYRRAVQKAAKGADFVLIDTPPGFADAALNAALSADIALLPVGPSPLDVMPARDAVQVIRAARDERGGDRPIIALVPSKLTATRMSRDLPDALEGMGELVLPPIGQRAAIADATASGLTVQEAAHRSKAALEFEALTIAVLELLPDA